MNLENFNYEELKPIIHQAVIKAHIKGVEDIKDARQQGFMEYCSSDSLQKLLNTDKDALCDKVAAILIEWYKPQKAFRDKFMIAGENDFCLEHQENHNRRLDAGETSIEIDSSGTEIHEI